METVAGGGRDELPHREIAECRELLASQRSAEEGGGPCLLDRHVESEDRRVERAEDAEDAAAPVDHRDVDPRVVSERSADRGAQPEGLSSAAGEDARDVLGREPAAGDGWVDAADGREEAGVDGSRDSPEPCPAEATGRRIHWTHEGGPLARQVASTASPAGDHWQGLQSEGVADGQTLLSDQPPPLPPANVVNKFPYAWPPNRDPPKLPPEPPYPPPNV